MIYNRINKRFETIKSNSSPALVSFTTCGDPDLETSEEILNGLAANGVDIIELGMPFSDPVADGPVIQLANERALANGASLKAVLAMVERYRHKDDETPIILMGYYNPIFKYGVEHFAQDARHVGVDGVIIVDMPPEEDEELRIPCEENDIHWIQLITPTSDEHRLIKLLQNASGFLYYVSVAGITGTKSADNEELKKRIEFIRQHSQLPIAVGFGIKTKEQVLEINKYADAAVVGSAIVNTITTLSSENKSKQDIVNDCLQFIKHLK